MADEKIKVSPNVCSYVDTDQRQPLCLNCWFECCPASVFKRPARKDLEKTPWQNRSSGNRVSRS